MSFMRVLIIAVFILAAAGLVIAQTENVKPETVASKLSPVDFMVGDWEGEGWIQVGRERKTCKVRETFSRKLDGSLLVVEGIGINTDPETGKETVVHNAYGVFYYDEAAKKIAFRYFKAEGAGGETYPEFSKNKLVWGFIAEPSKSEIKFTEWVDEKGFWIASGEVKPPGRSEWFPFFYMKLQRVK